MGHPQEKIDFAELERQRLIKELNDDIQIALKKADESKSYSARSVIKELRENGKVQR